MRIVKEKVCISVSNTGKGSDETLILEFCPTLCRFQIYICVCVGGWIEARGHPSSKSQAKDALDPRVYIRERVASFE